MSARRLARRARLLRVGLNRYPSYLGAGVSVQSIRADLRDVQGQLLATVHKTLYVRLKPRARQAP